MALLIDSNLEGWEDGQVLYASVPPLLPGVRVLTGAPTEPLPGVIMLTTNRLTAEHVRLLPDLRLVQKSGAGVETMVENPDLPGHVRIARMSSAIQGAEIAEFCLTHVLAQQRNLLAHAADQAAGRWAPRKPGRTDGTIVAVLGLGHIGSEIAGLFSRMGYRTLGWSRSGRAVEGVGTHAGQAGLETVLAAADHVISILPSTASTRNLFDARHLALMQPGATLINCGRGDAVVDADLLAALDTGTPGHAVLDVFREEPLPGDHPFWHHPGVTITPHVSGWHVDGMAETIANNYIRLVAGEPLLHEVDRQTGY